MKKFISLSLVLVLALCMVLPVSAQTNVVAHDGNILFPESDVYAGTALILPVPVNGSKTFEGWFTAAEGGTKIGTAGDSYVPAADIELFAQ